MQSTYERKSEAMHDTRLLMLLPASCDKCLASTESTTYAWQYAAIWHSLPIRLRRCLEIPRLLQSRDLSQVVDLPALCL